MLLSIIIPVYNASATLPRCLDSILAQRGITDFELLLVDDGSKDASAAICADYAARDSRIRVLRKENGGVSSARNLGLDKAQGEWVMFVDSDDVLLPTFGEINLAEFSEDMVAFPPLVVEENGEETRLDKEESCCDFAPFVCTTILRAPWSKFYRRSALGKLRFDTSIRFGEDFVFNLQFLNRIKAFRYDGSKVFYRYFNPGVDFYQKYAMPVEESVTTMAKMFDAFWKLGVKNEELERTYFLMMKRLCQTAIYQNPQAWFSAPEVKNIYQKVKHLFPLIYRLNYWLMSHRCINALRRIV